jgi:hypothetical protein
LTGKVSLSWPISNVVAVIQLKLYTNIVGG